MKPIVVAFREHEHPTAALRWAAELSRLTSAPLKVLSVYSPTYSEISPEKYEELIAQSREHIVHALGELRHTTPTIEIIQAGEPIPAIADYLSEHDAEMAVVGTHETEHNADRGFGSSAHHLLQHTHTPVVMVPPDFQPLAGGVIVLGIDGSTSNAPASLQAERLAKAAQATIHAVFAYDPMDDTFGPPDNWHRHSEAIRDQVAKITSVPTEMFMAAGHPTQVLLEHAARERAALTIVGTRGHGGFQGLRLGRVPAQLVAHATNPLLVVPH